MKLIRNNVFETNSSSTHSLVLLLKHSKKPKRIMNKSWRTNEPIDDITQDKPNFHVVCGSFKDGGRGKRIVPVYIDKDGKEIKLTKPEENASYLFTWLNWAYIWPDWDDKEFEIKKEARELLAKLHKLLLDLELKATYQMPKIYFRAYDYNYDSHYPDDPPTVVDWDLDIDIEHNDGGFIEDIKDARKILKNKNTLYDYLFKYKIKMKYEG